jgi:hypothetical protein
MPSLTCPGCSREANVPDAPGANVVCPTCGAKGASPDVRLNPLDPFTAHELAALRAETERALRGQR